MKKLIALFGGMIIAAGASAQTATTTSPAVQSPKTGTLERQVPANTDQDKRQNPVAEHPESANIVDPDFQGSSKHETTATGMGKPKQDSERSSNQKRNGTDPQDVEDKTKK